MMSRFPVTLIVFPSSPSVADAQNLRFINIETFETIMESNFNYNPTTIQFSPSDNHLLIFAHFSNMLEILNLNTGNIQTILAPRKPNRQRCRRHRKSRCSGCH